jgi:hypothetical protein
MTKLHQPEIAGNRLPAAATPRLRWVEITRILASSTDGRGPTYDPPCVPPLEPHHHRAPRWRVDGGAS